MTTSADLNKIRIAFMERASAPNVPPFAFKLAHLLAYKYMNRKSWSARPAQETLARDLNVSVRTVQRLTDILEPLGLVIMPGNGRGLASTYSIDPERATRVSPFPAQKGDKKGRQKPAKRVTPVSPQPSKNQEAEGKCLRTSPSAGRENALARDKESSPSAGAPPLTRHPADLVLQPQAKTQTEPVAAKG